MTFRSVAGHRRLVTLLSRAIARDTLPPAMLFAGPAGIGKRRVALALASSINCLEPASTPTLQRDACGQCASCRRIARAVHPDIIVIEPGDSGTIKIDDVRDVVKRAGYRPFEARRRVVIIDEADALVQAAQNALLKTLEEPPSASVFVLVSSMPDALLPTVLSRTPRLRFGPLSASDIAEVLVREHGYEEADARAAAADAEGSVARALSMESADVVEARDTAQRLLQQAARVTDPVRRLDLVKELTGRKTTPAAEREQLSACLRVMGSLLRDIGVLARHGDAEMLANVDLRAELDRLTQSYDSERSVRAYTAVDQALAAIERNASPKVIADWLVLQL
jgi:DNA polymerase III subunit delta'